jgi:hypothetical protein
MVAHCDEVFRIFLAVPRESIGGSCRSVGKHLLYDITKDDIGNGLD